MRRAGRWIGIGLVVLAVSLASGVRGQMGYTYGEAWWDEYRPHADTILLFHFGAPQEEASRAELTAAIEEDADFEALLDSAMGPAEVALLDTGLDPEAYRRGPEIDPSRVPEDHVQDYANAHRRVRLPPGMRKVPEGRFGAGLQTGGGGGLSVRVQAPVSLELHFRVERLPATEQVLWSMAEDESQLVLHPDGTLELKLRHPHGHPGAYPGLREKPSEAQVAEIRSRDATIRSPESIPVGEWVHARVYNHPHPTPGGGEPWDARLVINGEEVASYQSERYNINRWLGWRETRLVLGSNAEGEKGFTGWIDEVRLLSSHKTFYRYVPVLSRDAGHPLQFDRPWFRNDTTHLYASLDRGVQFDRHDGGAAALEVVNVPAERIAGIQVPGVRGKGWLIDPGIGVARVPLDGMRFEEGALEFWLRPVNWDDVTGYWHHSPPRHLHLNVLRLVGRDRQGQQRVVATLSLPRGHNIERPRIPLDAGRWTHVFVNWREGRGRVYLDGKSHGGFQYARGVTPADFVPVHAEFGILDDVTVIRHERPKIEIDEIVGYRQPLREDEIAQARLRWRQELAPIALYNTRLEYKWSLGKLEFDVTPLLPDEVVAAQCEVGLIAADDGQRVLNRLRSETLADGRFRFVLHEGEPLADGLYHIPFRIRDAAGKVVAEGRREWRYSEEPWRHSRAGILDYVPPPWTPIRVQGNHLETRMSRFALGPDGLPEQIWADGTALLAAPFQLLEDGERLRGKMTMGEVREDEVRWRARFEGRTLAVEMDCLLEYDGMIRYEMRVLPLAEVVAPLQFVMPMEQERATRYLAYPVGARGPFTGVVHPGGNGMLVSSRTDPDRGARRAFEEARKQESGLTWEDFRESHRAQRRAWGFYTHAGLNDKNRGLWWFCDNAAGWAQSQAQGAVEIVRRADAVALELNLIAEPVVYDDTRPIVFGIVPHPARPMPEAYRLYERVEPSVDPVATSIYDTFRPWPRNPRDRDYSMFPAVDPRHPEKGPSWEYAESCIPSMQSAMPYGTRTLYLSLMWLSCRAGAYDNWEWRSGPNSAVSLTPSFVNYLCWEMNEWIGRNIWDAIYLDEIYELSVRNLEAGFSIRLPDGTEQPGIRNFDVRDLMKRWRNIFHAHDREPIVIAHLTSSFLYHALVFCDSYLDGENTPIVSLNSRDWIDSTSQTRFEVIQNGGMWGLSSFFMPFIAEGGFDNKEVSRFPVWQWRQARQAQSMFAHFETATVYEGQGHNVYREYWKDVLGWGAGDPNRVAFVPYWNAAPAVTVDDQGGQSWVSYYHDPEGRLLLIASNRRQEDIVLRIAIDKRALGLPDQPQATSRDRTFGPPPGEDFGGAGQAAAEARALQEDRISDLAGGAGRQRDPLLALDIDDLLADPEEQAAAQQQAMAPRWEDGRLLVPVRARDYRVISLE